MPEDEDTITMNVDKSRLRRIKESDADMMFDALEVDKESTIRITAEMLDKADTLSELIALVTEDDNIDYFQKMLIMFGAGQCLGGGPKEAVADGLMGVLKGLLGAMSGGDPNMTVSINGEKLNDESMVQVDEDENKSWMEDMDEEDGTDNCFGEYDGRKNKCKACTRDTLCHDYKKYGQKPPWDM